MSIDLRIYVTNWLYLIGIWLETKKSGFKIKLQEVEQKNYAPAGKFLVQTKTETHKIKCNLNKFLLLQVFSIRTFLLVYTIKKQKEHYKT